MVTNTSERPRRLLQQFARYPVQGGVKTRLMTELSAAQACAVHETLLLATARRLLDARLGPVELWLDRADTHPCIDATLDLGVQGPRQQVAGDLGTKMHAALRQGLETAQEVVLVGSDCPGLDSAYLTKAFELLDQADVVLGPAEDGGYVLIGCRRVASPVFSNVDWGTERVLHQTLLGVEAAGLSYALLPERYDIDTPRDLRRWQVSDASLELV